MTSLELYFKEVAGLLALVIEGAAIVVVAIGALKALLRIVGLALANDRDLPAAKAIWLGFAAWIVLSLEFALAADIIQTAIAPNWKDIGQLAAIATIRTALNYYLDKDIDTVIGKGERAEREA